jgi:hypothetical protein
VSPACASRHADSDERLAALRVLNGFDGLAADQNRLAGRQAAGELTGPRRPVSSPLALTSC